MVALEKQPFEELESYWRGPRWIDRAYNSFSFLFKGVEVRFQWHEGFGMGFL
jgi:hypothetical protein